MDSALTPLQTYLANRYWKARLRGDDKATRRWLTLTIRAIVHKR